MVQQGMKWWLVQGQGQSGPYPQAVSHLQARQKQGLCTSCTSLMEIRFKIKLVRQSSTGMAVQRDEEYCWDTSPHLHRLCNVRSHLGCQKLCRLPQLNYGPLHGHGAQERPIPLLWICCLKPAETSVTHWGCASAPAMLLRVLLDSDLRSAKETLLSDEDFLLLSLLLLLSVSTLTATD